MVANSTSVISLVLCADYLWPRSQKDLPGSIRNPKNRLEDGCSATFYCNSTLVVEGVDLRVSINFAVFRG